MTPEEKNQILWTLSQKSSMFPDRLFAPCRNKNGAQFRIYGSTLAEIRKKAEQAQALKGYKVYNASLRVRVL